MGKNDMEADEVAKRAASRQVDLIKAYKDVFESEDGKVVLYDLMSKGYFLGSTLDTSSNLATHRNEGQRELVIYIIQMIEKDASKIKELIKFGSDTEQEYFE